MFERNSSNTEANVQRSGGNKIARPTRCYVSFNGLPKLPICSASFSVEPSVCWFTTPMNYRDMSYVYIYIIYILYLFIYISTTNPSLLNIANKLGHQFGTDWKIVWGPQVVEFAESYAVSSAARTVGPTRLVDTIGQCGFPDQEWASQFCDYGSHTYDTSPAGHVLKHLLWPLAGTGRDHASA
jgi:hypothetical protein